MTRLGWPTAEWDLTLGMSAFHTPILDGICGRFGVRDFPQTTMASVPSFCSNLLSY